MHDRKIPIRYSDPANRGLTLGYREWGLFGQILVVPRCEDMHLIEASAAGGNRPVEPGFGDVDAVRLTKETLTYEVT